MTIQLYIGSVRRLDDEGQSSAIYKDPVTGPIMLEVEGLTGDAQADRRVHGGPEKAVHHFAAENYAHLAERFPGIAAQLIPGSIGENISTTGWDERNVYIGDIFRLGDTRVQVSQPRSPCWKIDERFASEGMAAFIAEERLTGWYWRVLTPGQVVPGDPLLLEQPADAFTLAKAMLLWQAHRPPLADLEKLAVAPGIASQWQQKIENRVRWLAQQQAQQ